MIRKFDITNIDYSLNYYTLNIFKLGYYLRLWNELFTYRRGQSKD